MRRFDPSGLLVGKTGAAERPAQHRAEPVLSIKVAAHRIDTVTDV